MRVIRFHESAAEEAVEAAAWYELQRPGLGKEFDSAFEAALDLLEQEIVPLTPVPGAAGALGAMRLMLKRFPYDVVVLDHRGEAFVLAVAHRSRRPGYWRDRQRA
jgi:toxin ParE1/3/4